MKSPSENGKSIEAAAELRTIITELFHVPHPNGIILTPSILAGLHILLAHLKVSRIAISPHEYYDQHHFPNMEVRTFDVDSFADSIKRFRPNVVILSIVSWHGKTLPIRRIFRRIRATFGKKSPILIADCAHAGAVGFPDLATIGADIVCGDICKWITPPELQRNMAFLWFRMRSLSAEANRAFRPFFLATHQEQKHLQARWMDPDEVKTVVNWLKERRLDRAKLLRRHRYNMKLASKLARQLRINEPLESSIIWLGDDCNSHILLQELEQHGLVWHPPAGGSRILCRAEAQPDLTLLANSP